MIGSFFLQKLRRVAAHLTYLLGHYSINDSPEEETDIESILARTA
jgi:hypothetical protein